MKQSRSEDSLKFYVSASGFSYGDINNKTGKLNLRSIAKHFESGRAASFQGDVNKLFECGTHSAAFFIRFQIIELSETFHKTASVVSPWIMKTWISYLGTTSFYMESETRCQKTGSFLGRSLCQCVRVDRATRRPGRLPKNAFDKYQRSVTMETPPRFDFPSTTPSPDRLFKCSIKAMPSDTDSNNHVNQAVCFSYCSDCVSFAAAEGGILTKFRRDTTYYDLKTFKVEYVGEIDAGTVVDILCWEDVSDSAVLYFLLKVGERVASRCVGEWYKASDGELIVTKKSNIKSLF